MAKHDMPIFSLFKISSSEKWQILKFATHGKEINWQHHVRERVTFAKNSL